MWMLNTHPSPPSHALAKHVCWLYSHHVCLMFTSKSFSVTPSIFASRGAPSRLQSTAEGVACATQRATWRGWRLRGPTATLARALGGQRQMPWFQGFTWNILKWNSANWLTKNDSERTMYLTKQLKEKETSDEWHIWCWHCCVTAGIGPLFYKSNDHKTKGLRTASHCQCVNRKTAPPKKTRFWIVFATSDLLHSFFWNISTRLVQRKAENLQLEEAADRPPPSDWVGPQQIERAPVQVGEWVKFGVVLWIVCWSVKGIEMYWVISFNMATWEDLWYFTAN